MLQNTKAPLGKIAPTLHMEKLFWAKRLMDVLLAGSAIIILSPLFALLALLIKLESPGPVIYRQKRFGQHNTLFTCYKFRSMTDAACKTSRKEIVLTGRRDIRVTRIGKFLRCSSLDELPQLFNVVRGDMSLVGPRPHPPGVKAGERIYEEVIENFSRRYLVKPGITGLAQVSGARGNTFTEADLQNRFAYDLAYIENWSLWLDIKILLRTLYGGFIGKNAF